MSICEHVDFFPTCLFLGHITIPVPSLVYLPPEGILQPMYELVTLLPKTPQGLLITKTILQFTDSLMICALLDSVNSCFQSFSGGLSSD